MQSYLELLGIDTIDCLLADREFVGDHWLGYLNQHHIWIRENFWIVIPKNGHRVKASWLFKYGLIWLTNMLFSNDIDQFNECCKYLPCT